MDTTNMNGDDNFFDFLEKSPEPLNGSTFFPQELEDIFSPNIPDGKLVNENEKLRKENFELRKRAIEQESLLAEYELKLSQRMKEHFEMKKCVEEWKRSMVAYDNEISSLKLNIEQLKAENYQYKSLKMLNSPDSIEQMKKEITNKTNSVSRLKNQMVVQKRKFSENKKLSDGLLKHATCLWDHLITLGEMLSNIGLWNGTQKRMLETEFIENIKILGDVKLRDDKDILEVLNAINAVSIEESDNNMQKILCGQPTSHASSRNQQEALQKPVVSSSVPSPPLTSPSSCLSSPAVMEVDNSSSLHSNKPEICKENLERTPSVTNSSMKCLKDLASNKVSQEKHYPKRILDCLPTVKDCKVELPDVSDDKNPSKSKSEKSNATFKPRTSSQKLKSHPQASKISMGFEKDSLQLDLKPFIKTESATNFSEKSNATFKPCTSSQKLKSHPQASKISMDFEKDSLQLDLKPFMKTESATNFEDTLNEEISLEELCQLKYKIGLPEGFRCLSPLPPSPAKKRPCMDLEGKNYSNLEKHGSDSVLPLAKRFSGNESDSQDVKHEDFSDSKDKDICTRSDLESPSNYDLTIACIDKSIQPNSIDNLNSSDMNLDIVKIEKEEMVCDSSDNISSISSKVLNSDDKTNGMLSNNTAICAWPKVVLSNILTDEKEAQNIVKYKINSSREDLLKSASKKLSIPEKDSKANEDSSLKLPISVAPSNHLNSYQEKSTEPTFKVTNNSSESLMEDSVLTPKQLIQRRSSLTKPNVKCMKKTIENTSITIPARVRGRTLLKSQMEKDLEIQGDSKEIIPDEVKVVSKITEIPDHSELERPRKIRKEHKPTTVTESAINVRDKVMEKQNRLMNKTSDEKNKHSNSLEQLKSVTAKNTNTVINNLAVSKKCLRSHKLEKVKKMLNSEVCVLQTRLRNSGVKSSQANNAKRKNKKKNKKNKILHGEQNEVPKQKRKRNKGRKKNKGIVFPNPVALAFKGLQEMRETNLHSLKAENCLHDVLVDPTNVPNTATLLFFVIQFLLTSKYQSILLYVRTNGTSELIPVEEHCIVKILFKIEESNKPHLQNVLLSAVNTLQQVILSKTKLMLYPLSSLCRVLTLICHQKQSPLEPLSLCCDLLKTKNKLAPYLIGSVAAVWKDIFQVADDMTNEEKIFHCAVAYGAHKNINFHSEALKKSVEKFLKDFLSPPNVPDVNKIVEFLINKILIIICSNDLSPDLEYALTSPLTIFAVHEDWRWTKQFLLDKYVIPCIKKYVAEVNVVALNIFCNLYVDIFSMSPDGENEEVLTSIFEKGNTLVHDVTAAALMKLLLLQKKSLPSALSEWLEKNQNNPIIPSITVLLQRKVASNDCITLNDIVCKS